MASEEVGSGTQQEQGPEPWVTALDLVLDHQDVSACWQGRHKFVPDDDSPNPFRNKLL